MNESHEYYMFVFGMNEEDALFTDFIVSLTNTHGYSPLDLEVAFDGSELDVKDFLNDFGERFNNIDAALRAYNDLIPIYKAMSDYENSNTLLHGLKCDMWDVICRTIHWSKVKISVEDE